MTTTPMRRAGQLIAHLDILNQIRDVRQLLLLQLSMRERQDQVALFKRQEGAVTLSLIGTQLAAPATTLTHRAGQVGAAVLLSQLQALSGIQGDDVAFSAGQIGTLVDGETARIEQSEALARLDAALTGLVARLEPQTVETQTQPVETQTTETPAEPATDPVLDTAADAPEPQTAVQDAADDASPASEPAADAGSTPDGDADTDRAALVPDLPAGRPRRR